MDPTKLVQSYDLHQRNNLRCIHRHYKNIIQYILDNFVIEDINWTYDALLLYIAKMTTCFTKKTNFVSTFRIASLYPTIPKNSGQVVMFIKDIFDELAIYIFDRPFVECVSNFERFFTLFVEKPIKSKATDAQACHSDESLTIVDEDHLPNQNLHNDLDVS